MKKTSLVIRAVIAITLMIVFVMMALCIAVGLLYGAYHIVQVIPNIKGVRAILGIVLIAAGMVLVAGVILWSIFPRIDRFEAPGPELMEADHPALFEEIRQVAVATGQQMPVHVYLVPEVNAFVTERGGWMGLGSKRVMGLGLGLMNLLTVSELRAVIAHEFGHFDGGDTKLGPWIYKTRGAIIRTVENLHRVSDNVAEARVGTVIFVLYVMRKPFEWFGILYLRITMAISRAQEYSADALAVRTQGADALINGLKKVSRSGGVYSDYLSGEIAPLLELDYRPPLSQGFHLFLRSKNVVDYLDKREQHSLEDEEKDPYSSHPSLQERTRHAVSLNVPQMVADKRLAEELFRDIDAVDMLFYEQWTADMDAKLKPIRWEESAEAYIPGWRESQTILAEHLAQPMVRALDISMESMRQLFTAVNGEDIFGDADEWDEGYFHHVNLQVRAWAIGQYARGLSGLLLDHGYTATSGPGVETAFKKGDLEPIMIHSLISDYFMGDLSARKWVEFWTELGLENAVITAPASGEVTKAVEEAVTGAW